MFGLVYPVFQGVRRASPTGLRGDVETLSARCRAGTSVPGAVARPNVISVHQAMHSQSAVYLGRSGVITDKGPAACMRGREIAPIHRAGGECHDIIEPAKAPFTHRVLPRRLWLIPQNTWTGRLRRSVGKRRSPGRRRRRSRGASAPRAASPRPRPRS